MSEIKHYEVLTDFEMEEIAPNEWCLKKFIGFDPKSNCIEIPFEIEGKRIVALGDELFTNNKQIAHVKIDNGIQKIGAKAFRFCTSLKSIVLPESLVEIGEETFEHTSLHSLQLPDSVNTIGERVCRNCDKLATVSFSMQLKVIPKEAFYGCKMLLAIILPDSITEIHSHAFATQSPYISSINLPQGLTVIGAFAFYGINIERLFIPKNVKTIGVGAFKACQKLKEIIVEEGCAAEIAKDAFTKCVEHYPRVPDSIFDDDAAREYRYNKSSLENEIKKLGEIRCFIPLSVINIDECFSLRYAYGDYEIVQTHYENLKIYCEKGSAAMDWARKRSIKCADYKSNLPQEPKPITTATESPENATTETPTVSDESTPFVIESSEIADINDTKKQNSTSTVEAVSEVADENNDATLEADNAVEGNSVDIEEAVEEESDICEETTPVDPWAIFDYEDTDEGIVIKVCKDTSLQKVIVPDGVVEIGMKAFYAMENLEEVVLPEGLLYIGADAFHNCKKLSAVTLPQSLTKIGRSAFLGCRCSNEYKQFVIPENVVEIAPFALPQSLLAFKNKENWVRLDAISRKEKMMGKIPSDKLKFADKARDLYQKYNQDIWKRNK